MIATIIFISLVVAVAPMVAMLSFIWWVDRYDREPLRYVFGCFLWGAFGAFILSIIGSELSLQFFGERSPEREFAIGSILVAPTVEELMKGLILFFLLRYRDFDNVTDGLVYGAAAGLGFGMTENFLFYRFFGARSHGRLAKYALCQECIYGIHALCRYCYFWRGNKPLKESEWTRHSFCYWVLYNRMELARKLEYACDR